MDSEEVPSPTQCGLPLPLSLLWLGILKPSLRLCSSTVWPPSPCANLSHSGIWDLRLAEQGYTVHPGFQGLSNTVMSSVLISSSAFMMSLDFHVALKCPYTTQLHQNFSGCWTFPWFSLSHELMRNSMLWSPGRKNPSPCLTSMERSTDSLPREGLLHHFHIGPS